MKTLLVATLTLIVGLIIGAESAPVQQPGTNVNVRAAQNVVVYFNATWNANNHYAPIDKLTNCSVQKVMIDQAPMVQKKFNVDQVPCIVLFKNGVEVKRWEAGLAMKITTPVQVIQSEIR
jgi:hypothetical protein